MVPHVKHVINFDLPSDVISGTKFVAQQKAPPSHARNAQDW